ncbi:hypothetical protein PACTADRAFT_28857, partial [Pachysolen tannophilus NRRL Y-2460]
IHSITKELRKDSRSLRNRLQSIIFDSKFIINTVKVLYSGRPLIPNERCGLWYVSPEEMYDSCYFKSTDGHTGQWNFSTRRLNSHLLPIIQENNGIIIVDSTRRGKSMPDSLSKTVPIWCAVINYIMFGERKTTINNNGNENWLYIPPEIISKSEYSQINILIPKFAEKCLKLRVFTKEELINILNNKPLRPFWCHPKQLPFEPFDCKIEKFHPIICCTASLMCQDGIKIFKDFTYVQGAADDHELWSPSPLFNSKIFWQNIDFFQNSSILTNEQLIQKIEELIKINNSQQQNSLIIKDLIHLIPTNIYYGEICGEIINKKLLENYDLSIIFTNSFKTDFLNNYQYQAMIMELENENFDKLPNIIYIPFSNNKKNYKEFRNIVPILVNIFEKKLHQITNSKFLILSETTQDLSIGLILCILCRNYNLQWELQNFPTTITKDIIRQHLNSITKIKRVNPSRAILNSCNSFLF